MSGSASGGQKLTPNPNVFALVQMGGDTWGANGGGAVAIGGGATDQTGYLKPLAITPSDCETAENYIEPAQIPRTASLLSRLSNGFNLGTVTDTLAPGGTNAG